MLLYHSVNARIAGAAGDAARHAAAGAAAAAARAKAHRRPTARLQKVNGSGYVVWEVQRFPQAEPCAMPKPSSRKAEPDDSLVLEPTLIALRKAVGSSHRSRGEPVPLQDSPRWAEARGRALQHADDEIDASAVQLIGAGAPAGRG